MCQSLWSIRFSCVTLPTSSSLFCLGHQVHKSRLDTMKVSVLVMVIAVLVSTSTLEYGEAITSVELCEQIRSNQHHILTMGARGRTLDDAHFYILVEGGYMFKVPLANLHVNATSNTTSITIDREYIRADALFNVSRGLFTRKYRFFLISNENQDAFLGQMSFSTGHNESTFQLHDLSGGLSSGEQPHHIRELLGRDILMHVMASVGIDSNTTYSMALIGKGLYRQYIFEVVHKDELKVTECPLVEKFVVEFSRSTNLVTVFYHQENPKKEDGYYYFLDVDGMVTVSRRINALEWNWDFSRDQYFEVNLRSFVVCHFKQTTTDTSSAIEWTYWIVTLCLGTIVVLCGFAIYFYVGMKKEKAKRKDLKKKNRQNMSNLSSLASSNLNSSCLNSSNVNSSNVNSSNISSGTSSSNASSNAFTLTSNPTTSSSSMASKASSVLQSIKSGISSLLNRNKTEQAKTVVKAKNSKAKSKKPKSPK